MNNGALTERSVDTFVENKADKTGFKPILRGFAHK